MNQGQPPQEQVRRLELADIRKRPGMWTGSTDAHGLHYLLEIVFNLGLAEAHEGRCTQITVTLAADDSVMVEHDGHGLSSLANPDLGLVALERALTEVERRVPPLARGYESWLCAVNALSTKVTVEVKYAGMVYRQSYSVGIPDGPAVPLGVASGEGLRIAFRTDPTIFEGEFQYEILEARLQVLAFLHPGLHFVVSDERPGRIRQQHFQFNDGLIAFARFLEPSNDDELTDPIEITGQYETGDISAVLHFFDAQPTISALYANDRETHHGGTGLDGLLEGTVRVLSRIGRSEGVIKDTDHDLYRHDVALGLTVILSVHLDEVRYGGNIWSWVGNPELALQMQWLVDRQLGAYLAAHPTQALRIVRLCLTARQVENHRPWWHHPPWGKHKKKVESQP